jgi:hypothetical protein
MMFITKIKSEPAFRQAALYLAGLVILTLLLPVGLCAFFCVAWMVAFYVELSGKQAFLSSMTRSEGYFIVLVPYQILLAAWGYGLVLMGKTSMFMQVVCPVTLFMFIWLWPAIRVIRSTASTRLLLAAVGIVLIIYEIYVLWSNA